MVRSALPFTLMVFIELSSLEPKWSDTKPVSLFTPLKAFMVTASTLSLFTVVMFILLLPVFTLSTVTS